ncbi:hypothetical protein [Paractinoplanes rishiriensis]|uniref:YcxB-like protein domain-containing protein n=1 Tax=Paractinoplanes rishiriensis TaxID=1050105 RepID=A0A919K357_9ACTN|nr:hypothetical protein [Actinoplanes rishiriensis]GIE99358.1 hypothetical protein Ari01nite_68230 [Actinoplanes rishiriensis]
METDAPFVFTAQLTQDQIRAAVRRAARKFIRFSWCAGVLFVLYGVTLWAIDPGSPWAALLFAAAGAVIGFGGPMLQLKVAVGRATRTLDQPTEYRFDTEGVRSANQLADSLVRWPLIGRAEQLDDLLLLWLGKGQVIPVPVGRLPAGTRAALIAFVEERRAARPADAAAVRPPTP